MQLKQVLSLSLLGMSLALTGCSFNTVTQPNTSEIDYIQGPPFKGSAMGGQQPIGTSNLYIYAADQTAYGHVSKSLIGPDTTDTYPSHLDSSGNYYIVTDPTSGNFALGAHQYSCPAGSQVYLYLSQGNVGNGNNTAISEMAIMGTCSSSGFSQLTGSYVYMNEVSTVAAAYALAGFATDSTDISSGPSGLAAKGLQNAFAIAPNIYNINAGAAQGALSTTPGGNGTVPTALVNSIADMLASCINSSGASSTSCTNLFSYSGTTTGGLPSHSVPEVSTAAINIAHNPGSNVANLFTLFTNTAPFQPTSSPTPNDLSLVISYSTSTGSGPEGMAIDASGNIWITNNNIFNVSELNNQGKILSGSGYTNTSMEAPTGIAIDNSGNVWVADESPALIKFVPSGGTVTSTAYTPFPGSADPQGVAIDGSGYVWVALNNATAGEFNPTSHVLNLTATGGGLSTAQGTQNVAMDTTNDVFIADYKSSGINDAVSSFTQSGTDRSTSVSGGTGFFASTRQRNGTAVAIDSTGKYWMTNAGSSTVSYGANDGSTAFVDTTGSAAAGLSNPQGMAFDSSGHLWIADSYGAVSVLDGSGNAITGTAGYTGGLSTMSGIAEVAVDGSGNVWILNNASGNVFEFVGGGTPVMTPLVANLSLHAASKP